MHPTERQRLADRLRSILGSSKLTEAEVARAMGVDQPFISRLLDSRYEFETPKIERVFAYVKMQESGQIPKQLELPFETTLALSRFAKSNGDFTLLNSLIEVLASHSH